MVVDKLDAAVVGIEEFVGNRTRLVVHGCIKAKPEDFVVREISEAGDVVDFSDESDCLPTEREREVVLKKLEAAQKEKRERLVFDEPANGWRTALTELIGAKSVQDVENVMRGQTEECSLVSPVEFRARVYLQVCIQNCFPGLDCKMQKFSMSGDQHETQHVKVLLDPIYKKFRDGGMTLENCDRLLTFLRKGASDPSVSTGIELEHDDTREARTVLHRLIAKISSSFKTKTETRNGVQRLVVYFMPKSVKKRKRSQPQEYLRFVLQKTNEEHFTCFDRLARHLRRPLSAFSYAGTKDKTAITFQHVVVTGVAADRLLNFNNHESGALAGIRVGDLKYVETPMSLGGSNGNRFSIMIRGLSSVTECTSDVLRTSLDSTLSNIKCKGFVNYFGFQRVGAPTNSVRAHHIGQKIVAGNYEDALRLILAVQDSDSDDAAKAKQLYLESGDVEAALKLMPLGMHERQLLQGLKRYGSDAFEQAVQSIQFSRRVMYMHAYQSYLFNRMASYRLRRYGTKVVEGDLIQCHDTKSEKSIAVKAATAEEADILNSSHEDAALSLVFLPLPGTSVMFPSNTTKEACFEMMEQDGTKSALSESGPLKGAYRPLVAFPQSLEWSWPEDQDNSLSLQLSFSLDSGCFATMCLREVLHSDV